MPRTQYDSPFIKWEGQAQRALPERNRKPPDSKHDNLCVTVSGLKWCWCKCARCWDSTGRRCICAHCKCRWS